MVLSLRMVLVLLVLGSLVDDARAQRPPRRGTSSDRWVVVQVGEELRVVAKSAVKDLQAQLETDHKAALRTWSEARNAARKSKTKFSDPKPTKPRFKSFGGSHGSEEEAQKALTRVRAGGQRSRGTPRPAKDAWTVVEVGEERRVVKASGLAALRKDLDQQFRATMKEWDAARKAARKAKTEFSDPRPTKARVRDLGKSFATEEEAQAWLEKGSG